MASIRNRYSKSLEGLNAVGFVSPQLEYSVAANFAAFVALSAVAANNGLIGVFRPDLANTPIQAVALVPNDKFFIAQIVDGQVKKTVTMTFGKANGTSVRQTPYNAPVKQSVTLGWTNPGGVSTITPPLAGDTKTFVLSVRDTSPSTQPFPVQEGRVDVKNPNASPLEIASALVFNFMNAGDYENNADINFVKANIITDAANAAIAGVTATFFENSTTVAFSGAHTLLAGDYVKVISLGIVFKVAQVVSPTVVIIDRPWPNPSFVAAAGDAAKITAAAAQAAVNVGIVITTYVEDTTFVVSLGQDLQGTSITVFVPWKQGAGAPWQVAAMEDQTQVMDGYTTLNAAFTQDYGAPTKFAINPETSTIQYAQIYITAYNKTESMAYANELTASKSNVILASPNAGLSPFNELNTIFPVGV